MKCAENVNVKIMCMSKAMIDLHEPRGYDPIYCNILQYCKLVANSQPAT